MSDSFLERYAGWKKVDFPYLILSTFNAKLWKKQHILYKDNMLDS